MAMLALVLKVLVPPGFMVGSGASAGFPLVICTGHGPAAVLAGAGVDPAKKSPADRPAHDAPCAFAGHGVSAPPPDPIPQALAAFAPEPAREPVSHPRDLAPGRGLAAPPPPPRGPPSALS
jgi:hypothetical protein